MRNFLKAVYIVLLSACCAWGGTITLASGVSPGQSNDAYGAGTPNVVISPDPSWANPFAGSFWVSFANTVVSDTAAASDYPMPPALPVGGGPIQVPNGTVINFTQTFTLNALPGAGFLDVMADDSASVIVNGIVIFDEATNIPGNTYSHCSDTPIGCRDATAGIFGSTFLNALKVGSNTITFQVAQRQRFSYGLDYFARIDEVPEPGTLFLLGLGASAVALLKRRPL